MSSSSVEIREYLESLQLCKICILRYQNTNTFVDFENVKNVNDLDVSNTPKRFKRNVCIACLNIFESIESVADEIIANSTLNTYEGKFYCFHLIISIILYF